MHSWFNYRKCDAAVRASLYLYNTEEEARKFIDVLGKTIGLFNPLELMIRHFLEKRKQRQKAQIASEPF